MVHHATCLDRGRAAGCVYRAQLSPPPPPSPLRPSLWATTTAWVYQAPALVWLIVQLLVCTSVGRGVCGKGGLGPCAWGWGECH